MEEAVVEREAIKEAAKAKRRERRLQLQAQKERTAEADRVASLYGNCCVLSRWTRSLTLRLLVLRPPYHSRCLEVSGRQSRLELSARPAC